MGLIASVMLLAAGQAELPVFEFRGITAGVPADASALKRCTKDKEIEGAKSCFATRDVVAGVTAMTLVGYYQDKLSYVAIESDRSNYGEIARAFREKYGSPCETKTEPWKSRGGVTQDNSIAIWCFKTGKLKLEAIGSSLTKMVASYEDENKTPAAKPKVDF